MRLSTIVEFGRDNTARACGLAIDVAHFVDDRETVAALQVLEEVDVARRTRRRVASVTVSGRPAASAAAKSDERISPAAMFHRNSVGAVVCVADSVSPLRAIVRISPLAGKKAKLEECAILIRFDAQ